MTGGCAIQTEISKILFTNLKKVGEKRVNQGMEPLISMVNPSFLFFNHFSGPDFN